MQGYFDEVYAKQRWSSEGKGSGPGSTMEYCSKITPWINQLIVKYNIKSITDVSCGRMNWWVQVLKLHPDIKFIGNDISTIATHQNQQEYKDYPNWSFTSKNAIDGKFETTDLVVCRHTMMHLSVDNANNILHNIQSSGCKYMLLTSHPNVTHNTDINRTRLFSHTDGAFCFKLMNLQLPPFNCTFTETIIEPRQQGKEILGLVNNQ